MDSESKELLREWLVRTLEPICDADPEVLSKYVLALVQNNPKKEGLKDTCTSKLEEFLGEETVGFVNRLFKSLEKESYKSSGTEEGEEREDNIQDDRRRPRSPSNGEEEERTRQNSKRRRDEDRRSRDRSSPRNPDHGRSHRAAPYGHPREMRGRGGGGREGRGGYGRRNNFPPEWMPPMGMWPPHFGGPPPGPPGRGFPPHPMGGDFDPAAFEGPTGGMMPPPMMMPHGPMGGPPYFAPHGRGGGGRSGRGRGGGRGGRGSGGGGAGEGSEIAASGEEENNSSNPEEKQTGKTTLRVSNVDPKYINMAKLTLHFSKFGNVVNVQMRPNFKCAFVQYATEEEAKKAFHSPIPVCNNRFIEVKWAKYDPQDPLGAPSMTEQEAEDGSSTCSPEKQMTAEELRAAALEKGRKVLEEKRELLEKQKQLTKQKEELLKRQLAQQKEILEKMSQSGVTVSVEDKRELLNKITSLSEELKALQRGSGLPVPSAASAVTATAASGTGDLHGLKEELSALEAQAAGNGVAAAGGRGAGGRGGYFGAAGGRGGRGRWGRGGRMGGGRMGGGRGALTLDNRTTIVLVEKLPEEARDPSVLEQHFGNFGQVEKVVLDEKNPGQAYIKFHDRYSGQTAQTHGTMYGTSKLEMKWVEPTDAPEVLATSNTPHELTPTSATTTAATQETEETS